MIFLDTSAIYALADRGDAHHGRATSLLESVLGSGERFLTHNYVLLESMALLHHRLGLPAALAFADDVRAFELDWIDRARHEQAVAWLRASRRPRVSLVDAVSFAVMRARRLEVAFAFDRRFAEQGFRLLASSA